MGRYKVFSAEQLSRENRTLAKTEPERNLLEKRGGGTFRRRHQMSAFRVYDNSKCSVPIAFPGLGELRIRTTRDVLPRLPSLQVRRLVGAIKRNQQDCRYRAGRYLNAGRLHILRLNTWHHFTFIITCVWARDNNNTIRNDRAN
jgi:hypothetical protein